MKRLIVILLLIAGIQQIKAQSHQWANNVTSSSKILPFPLHLAIDSNNNIYEVIKFYDSLNLTNGSVTSDPTSTSFCFVKLNTNGKYIWKKLIISNSNKAGALDIRNIHALNNNRIRICGTFTATKLKFSNTDSLTNSSYMCGFIATFDSSGNCLDLLKIFEDDKLSGFGPVTADNFGNIYFTLFASSDSFSIVHKGGKIKISNASKRRIVLFKLNPQLSNILWYSEFPIVYMINGFTSFYIKNLKIGKDNFLYLACELSDTYTFYTKVFNVKRYSIKGMYACLSPNGKPVFSSLINEDLNQNDAIMDIAARDTNFIYILGYAKDSILNSKKWYTSSNKNSFGTSFPFIGLLSGKQGVKWLKLTNNKDTINWLKRLSFGGNISLDKENNAYCVFVQANRQIAFGGLIDSNKLRDAFVKIDSFGSALWLRPAALVYGFKTDFDNNLVYNGAYQAPSLYLAPFTLKSKFGSGFTGSGYIAKTYDYKIVRGDVKKGPYCSGDTILVPYTKIGVFDSSNYFVAELSDEFGNFNGNERELGRVKTNKDSVVIGRLPNFQVSTSDKYRVRIRATKPAVQGFYRPDTLRLRIYSRDKANPGPAVTICRGDTLQLNTYGGSKWTWSPAYHINNTSARQPKVWPDTTTRYKIIISDAYGCGAPDTAFKTVVVRKDPNIVFTSSNAIICKQASVKIAARFEHGDSNAYQNHWFFIDSASHWIPIASSIHKFKDSIVFTPPAYFSDSLKVVCVLSDGCSPFIDTAFFTLFIKKLAPRILLPFNDSLVCQNQSLAIAFSFVNVDSNQISYQWYYVSSPTSWFPLSNGFNTLSDTFNYAPANSVEKLVLVLSDHCTFKRDTAYVTLRLRSNTKLTSRFNDTQVCYGNTLKFEAKAIGGLSTSYTYQWKDVAHNALLSSNKTLSVLATKSIHIQLSVSDGCIAGDTTSFVLSVTPPLSATILTSSGSLADSVLCYNRSIALHALSKGGKGSGYRFGWYLDAVLASSADTFLLNPKTYFSNAASSHRLVLVLGDNCSASDSVVRVMRILEAPVADFSVGNTCNGSPVGFTFTGSKASAPFSTSYAWDFAGLATSNLQNPQYRFTSSGLLPVSLLVSSSNGCSDFISKNIPIKQQATAAFSVDDICQGDTAKFINQSLNAQSYRWKLGDGNTSLLFNPRHRYTISGVTTTFNVSLTAIVPNGCSDSIIRAITVNASPSPGFKYTTSGQTVHFTANESRGTEYLWNFGDGGSSKVFIPATSYTYSKFPSGTYNACLIVTNTALCRSEACETIYISGAVRPLNHPVGFQIYPNPSNGLFVAEVDEFKTNAHLLILNAVGQTVYSRPVISSRTLIEQNLPEGLYTVCLQSGNTRTVLRLQVLR